jgi:hypothetical protein
MSRYEDSEMPEPITKQLLEIRKKPKDLQLNDPAVKTGLCRAMRAVRGVRSVEQEGLERSPSGYDQVDEEKFERVKEPVSQPLSDALHRMKDPFEVLRKKEMDLCRVREEITALRLVIPLLIERP